MGIMVIILLTETQHFLEETKAVKSKRKKKKTKQTSVVRLDWEVINVLLPVNFCRDMPNIVIF